ncbi:hypothetical protein LUZ60_000341 [Juncus effusus]|nr:hypothetical protein LUZ60_000341 [Juncus effusus]
MATTVAMAVALFSPSNQTLISTTLPLCASSRPLSFSVRAQGGNKGRKFDRVWRRRKLKREDYRIEWKYDDEDRSLFLEEHMNDMRQIDKHICADIDALHLNAENRFAFVNEIIDETNKLVKNNEDEYVNSGRRPVLQALTNRINEMGYKVADAYMEPRPYDDPELVKRKYVPKAF